MNPIPCLLERNSPRADTPTAVVLPGGQRFGAEQASRHCACRVCRGLAHIATGEVGASRRTTPRAREFDGSVRDLMAIASQMIDDDPSTGQRRPRARFAWWRRVVRRSRSRALHRAETDARQVQFHYDVSDDFYASGWTRCASTPAPTSANRDEPGRGAAGQARPHLPQADAARRRALPRHRRRLGRPAAVGRRAGTACAHTASRCRRTSTPTSTA